MSLFTTPDAAAVWAPATHNGNHSAVAGACAAQQPHMGSIVSPGPQPGAATNGWTQPQVVHQPAPGTFPASHVVTQPTPGPQPWPSAYSPSGAPFIAFPSPSAPQTHAAGPVPAACPMTLVQLPNGQVVFQPVAASVPAPMAQPVPAMWAANPNTYAPQPQQPHAVPLHVPAPGNAAFSTPYHHPAAPMHPTLPQQQHTAPKSFDATTGGPRGGTGNGARSAVPPPQVEPLRTLVAELSTGLKLRDVTTVCTAKTPIADDRIDELVSLTYRTFSTDRDLMGFVKMHFSVELCLQIRDRLTVAHREAVSAAPSDDAAEAAAKTTVLGTDMLERRGVLVVSLIEVLCTIPTPCSHEEQFAGASDSEKNLTSFCPLTRCVFQTLFGACVRSPRGCIALLRLFSSTATAPRPVDNMVRQVTARLDTLVFDSHANYLVSHVLCTCELSTADPRARVFEPIPRDEMLARTPMILALAAVNSKAPQQADAGTTRRIATASPAVWTAFVQRLVEVLSADVVRTGTHREASHILEHAIRHFDYQRVPAAADLLTAVTADPDRVLLPLAQSPCGRHCVRAVAEVLAARGAELPLSKRVETAGKLRQLQARVRASPGLVSNFDAIDNALKRLPEC